MKHKAGINIKRGKNTYNGGGGWFHNRGRDTYKGAWGDRGFMIATEIHIEVPRGRGFIIGA